MGRAPTTLANRPGSRARNSGCWNLAKPRAILDAVQDRERIQPASRAELRRWLQRHHADSPGVWVLRPKVRSDIPGPTYEELVEEALCFGWIDSVVRPVPEPGLTSQYISPRKPGSIWAKTNKARLERLFADGRMAPAGIAVVERAKADGSWTLLDDVEGHVIAPDLAAAFTATPGSREQFEALSVSVQERALYWIYSVKRPATRAAHIAEVVEAASRGTYPPALG